jgi:nucleoside-diphosphate-sugar epimerase
MSTKPILVTGAAGRVGSVGFKIVELLRQKGLPVRAMVRRFDERSEELKKLGAQVVKADFLNLSDLHKSIEGCSRIYFGMGVSDSYLEGALNTAAVAKHHGVEIFVNISQLTVSQMSVYETTDSHQ